MDQIPSKTFCVLPWVHVYADERGHFYPCCVNRESSVRADDEKGMAFQLGSPQHFERAWNSENRKKMRLQFLASERPASCARCFLEEDAGGKSYRMQMNEKYLHSFLQQEKILEDGTAPFHIKFLDLRLGNICNLRCRMCTPVSSKLILEDYKNIYNVDIDKPEWLSLRSLDWFKQKDFWDSLPKLMPHLDFLHFAGGEPLIIQESFDFLAKLVELGYSKNISLSYNSNLTKLPQRALELWPKFKSVRMMVSLDGFGELNEYIRFSSRWSEVEKNIRELDARAKDYNCTELSVHTTVQIYNVFQLKPLVDFVSELKKFIPFPDLSPLYGPEQFNIQALPAELKIEAEKSLRSLLSEDFQNSHADNFKQNVMMLIGHLHAKDLTSFLPMFRKATKAFDGMVQNPIAKILPPIPGFQSLLS